MEIRDLLSCGKEHRIFRYSVKKIGRMKFVYKKHRRYFIIGKWVFFIFSSVNGPIALLSYIWILEFRTMSTIILELIGAFGRSLSLLL